MTPSTHSPAPTSASVEPQRRANRRFGWALVAGNLAIACLLVTIGWAVLAAGRSAEQLRAREAVENIAATLSSEIASELRQVDNALVTVARLYRLADSGTSEARAEVRSMLLVQRSLLPQVNELHLADAAGSVVFPPAPQPVNVGDRDYFAAARGNDRMVLSAPLIDRMTGQWSIVVARQLLSGDDEFDGIVFAMLTTEHFRAMFRRLEIGPSGAITLRNSGLQLLARHSDPTAGEPDLEAGAARVSAELLSAFSAHPRRGWFTTKTSTDGVERLSAYRAVGDYPLVLLAGLASDDFLRDWQRQAIWLSCLLAAVSLTIAAFSVGLFDRRRKQSAATLQLQQLAREQDAMLNNDLVGMARVKNRGAVWQNRALEHIFGYADGELDHHPTRALYLDDDSYAMVGAGYAMLESQGRFRTQLKMRRKDGGEIWIDLSGAPVSADESLWMLVDITAIKAGEERLKHMALHDPLTQLPNRTLFVEKASMMLSQDKRHGACTALCFLDLDHFKPVNDSYGHEAGDQLLKAIAGRLQQCMREGDIVARLGGDEFALALGSLKDAEELMPILDRLLEAVSAPLPLGKGRVARVTASIGVAMAPDHGQDLQSLQRLADEAQYAAKGAGRNCARLCGTKIVQSAGDMPS